MGNAQDRREKTKPCPKSRRESRAPRIPRHILLQLGNLEDIEITQGYQCRKCPHHPVLMEEDLAGHRDLHKIQKTLTPSCFREVIRIPADHPMIANTNRRLLERKISRTGVIYYKMMNPIVLSRRMEDDPLVRERYNEALQRQNGQNSTRPIEPVDITEEAGRPNEEPAASARASGSRKTRSSRGE